MALGTVNVLFSVQTLAEADVQACVAVLDDPGTTDGEKRLARMVLTLNAGLHDLLAVVQGIGSGFGTLNHCSPPAPPAPPAQAPAAQQAQQQAPPPGTNGRYPHHG